MCVCVSAIKTRNERERERKSAKEKTGLCKDVAPSGDGIEGAMCLIGLTPTKSPTTCLGGSHPSMPSAGPPAQSVFANFS